jgi:hypothetical protein
MSMGSPGDSPFTDLLQWGLPSEFAEDITLMLLRLKSDLPQELVRLPWDASRWTLAEHADAGRQFLYGVLERHGVDTAYYRKLRRT